MSLACASLRRAPSEPQTRYPASKDLHRTKSRARRASIAAGTEKELHSLAPRSKRHKLCDEEDKENRFQLRNDVPLTPVSGLHQPVPAMSWSVRRFLMPIKEEALDQSSAQVNCLPKNFLTPKTPALFKKPSSRSKAMACRANHGFETPKSIRTENLILETTTPVKPIRVPHTMSKFTEDITPAQPRRIVRQANMRTIRRPEPIGERLPESVTVRSKVQPAGGDIPEFVRPEGHNIIRQTMTRNIITENATSYRPDPEGGAAQEVLLKTKQTQVHTPSYKNKRDSACVGGIKLQLSPMDSSNVTCSSPLRGCDLSPCQRDPASPEQSEPSDTMSELYTSKALNNLSVISQQPGSGMHEQASSANLSGAFHSTFNYPLHSTLNYPLHSTFSMANDFIPKAATKTRKPPVTRELQYKLKDISTAKVLEVIECDSSCLSEESIDVDEYAAKYDSIGMKRQKGKAELSGNRMLPRSDNDLDDTVQHVSVNNDMSETDETDRDNQSTLTHVTCASLGNVWYSPNNTLRVSSKLRTSRQQEKSHHSQRHRSKRHSLATPTTPAARVSGHGTKRTGRSLSGQETPRYHGLSTQHSSEGDSGCSNGDSRSYRHVMISDNTGRRRTIAVPDTPAIQDVTSERKKLLVERMKSFNSSCSSHSVLTML